MNNIKSIIEEQEEELLKILNDREQTIVLDLRLKDFLRQSQKTLAQAIIKELVGEEKWSGGIKNYQADGFNEHRAEAIKKGEDIIKELK